MNGDVINGGSSQEGIADLEMKYTAPLHLKSKMATPAKITFSEVDLNITVAPGLPTEVKFVLKKGWQQKQSQELLGGVWGAT